MGREHRLLILVGAGGGGGLVYTQEGSLGA